MHGKKWVLAKRFEGQAKEDNIELVEFELPELKQNEVLCKALYLSVDPYMRAFTNDLPLGSTMIGEQLAEVIQSKNGEFPVGTLVLASVGWATHFISDGKNLESICLDLGDTPKSYCLGSLGMPGATAYLAFIENMKPKAGETVLVNGAAGAVGSLVGQLAKINGCKVIAFVGSEDKVNWCKNELGFDHVFNYKKIGISDAVNQVAPEGVDIFFDNVGGDFYHTVVSKHMKVFGRVCICGAIETYNDKEARTYSPLNLAIFTKDLTIKGFLCFNQKQKWPAALVEMHKYIKEGKIKVRETVYEGFDKMRDGFMGLFKGDNYGKAIIKV